MTEMILRRLTVELPRYTYLFKDEKVLQDGISKVLDGIGIAYQREYIADEQNRFDFLLDGGVVIEAKIKGGFGSACQQCDRYAQLELVKAIVVVTNKPWPSYSGAMLLRDKPFSVVRVKRQAF